MSFSTETSEGQVVPNLGTGITTLPFSVLPSGEQQCAKLHFVENDVVALPISDGYAKYV